MKVAVQRSSVLLDSLEEHLIAGTLLTALIVLLFLKNLRSTIIIAVAIPVSLLGAVAVMYFLGYTFNSMTMLGLLLLIGVVVDDAIVVLENIFRHAEENGTNPVDAAINGTRQVVFAVMAATLTLVAIFAPVIFMQGVIGRFGNFWCAGFPVCFTDPNTNVVFALPKGRKETWEAIYADRPWLSRD